MTILIAFHQGNSRTLKHFYLRHVCLYWGAEFPNLVSYSRFVQLKKEVGYISKAIREALHEQGVHWVYKVRKNMEPLDVSVSDEVVLKKRVLLESVIRELKTQTQVEHSRHRSFENFQVNVFSALIAYQLLENKPTLNLAELQGVSDLPVIF